MLAQMSGESTFTLLIDGDAAPLAARGDGDSVRIPAQSVASVLGWEIKPQGLCRGEVCIPLRNAAELVGSDGVDLAVLARLIGRPLALDAEEGAGCLGSSPAERAAQLATLEAPDFTLPDLDGKPHSLSRQRGKKVLLVAYASW
jgi:hypothetical protein